MDGRYQGMMAAANTPPTNNARREILSKMADADGKYYESTFRPLALKAKESFANGDMATFGNVVGELSNSLPMPYRYKMGQDGSFGEMFRSTQHGGYVDTGRKMSPLEVMEGINGILKGEQKVLAGIDMQTHIVNPDFLQRAAQYTALAQIASGDDEDYTAKLRRKLPESNLFRDMVMYGAPAIGGVTIGSTLRIETPVTRGLTGRGSTYKDVAIDSLAGIIGIPWALAIERPNQFFEATKHRNVPRAVEALVPTFAANLSQAWRLYFDGQHTVSGRPINVPGRPGARKLTLGEAAGKALGFQPVSNTKSFAAFQAEERSKKVRSDKIDALTVMALRTVDSGNPAGRAKMLKELHTWNEKMRAEGKLHMLIKIQDVDNRARARRRENRRTPETMRKEAAYRQLWGM